MTENQTPATTERAHHPYSPSTLQCREVCPAWVGTGESTEKAEIGTRQHAVTETGKDDDTLSDEQVAASVECMEFGDSHKAQLERFGPVQDLQEVYLRVDDVIWEAAFYDPKTYKTMTTTLDCTTGGYVDRVLIGGRGGAWAIIMDWKFGKWPVEKAKNNVQGISYLLGIFRQFPSVRVVDVYFKQPHIEHITMHRFFRRDADRLLLRIRTIVARSEKACRLAAQGDYSMANPTVPGCLFCGRIADCHKMHEIVLHTGKKYHPIEFPESLEPSVLRDPKNFSLGMRLQQAVIAWGEAYRRRGVDFIITGQAEVPPGYRLAEYSKATVDDVEKFKRVALHYLTEDEFNAALKPTITGVSKKIMEGAPRGQKTNRKDEFRRTLEAEGVLGRTTPVPYLMPVSEDSE